MLHKTKRMRYRAAWNHSGKPAEPAVSVALEAARPELMTAGGRMRALLQRADEAELRIVRRLCASTRLPLVRSLTLAVNLLGNGWLYVPLALIVLLAGLPQAHAVLACAALSVACAHVLYAVLKRRIARLRPFERDRSLPPLAQVLDRYSFPSGHCMTLAAVLVPLVRQAPALWPIGLGALVLLGWCRLASAHHYPSDVLAGMGIGAAVALPIAGWMLPL